MFFYLSCMTSKPVQAAFLTECLTERENKAGERQRRNVAGIEFVPSRLWKGQIRLPLLKVLVISGVFLWILFVLFYVYEWLSSCIYVHYVHPMTTKARKGHYVP